MGTLVFVCPATGQEISTGIEIETATLAHLQREQVNCPHCREPHAIAGLEAYVLGRDFDDGSTGID